MENSYPTFLKSAEFSTIFAGSKGTIAGVPVTFNADVTGLKCVEEESTPGGGTIGTYKMADGTVIVVTTGVIPVYED
jgi:hypothetical protein